VSKLGVGPVDAPAGTTTITGTAPAGLSVAVVASRFNAGVVQRLLDAAVEHLETAGVPRDHVTVVLVPGAFELPLACRRLAEAGHDAVVALGCVIRGETPHFDYVCAEAARGIGDAARDTGVPVGFGVITANTPEQAEARAGGDHGNMGASAAAAALEMASLLGALRPAARRLL
jgi:6,7-dimethyl-8-ribityllumazine synthase